MTEPNATIEITQQSNQQDAYGNGYTELHPESYVLDELPMKRLQTI